MQEVLWPKFSIGVIVCWLRAKRLGHGAPPWGPRMSHQWPVSCDLGQGTSSLCTLVLSSVKWYNSSWGRSRWDYVLSSESSAQNIISIQYIRVMIHLANIYKSSWQYSQRVVVRNKWDFTAQVLGTVSAQIKVYYQYIKGSKILIQSMISFSNMQRKENRYKSSFFSFPEPLVLLQKTSNT